MRIALTADGPGVGTTTIGRIIQTFYGFKHINMSDELIDRFAQAESHCETCAGLLARRIKENRALKEEVRHRLKDFAEQSQWARDYQIRADYQNFPDIVIEKYRTPEQYAHLKSRGFIMVKVVRIGAPTPAPEHAVHAPHDLTFTSARDVPPMEVVENLFNWLCDCEQWRNDTPQD